MRYALIVISIMFGLALHGQAPDLSATPDHTPMMDQTWETINKLMFKVAYKDKAGEPVITPFFPPALKSLAGKSISLSGYLIPIEAGVKHQHFMISVLPVMQCMFCGQGDIPPMVEVWLKEGSIKYTETPITIHGRMFLNEKPDSGAEVQVHAATIDPSPAL